MSSKKRNQANRCWLNIQDGDLNVFYRVKDDNSVRRVVSSSTSSENEVMEVGSVGIVAEELKKLVEKPPFPMIINDVLYGDTCGQVDKGVTKLPHATKRDIVQLSPETMALCGLCLGQPAIVTSAQAFARLGEDAPKSILMAWPVQGLPAGSVGVHEMVQRAHSWTADEEGEEGGGLLRVEAVKGSVAPAAAATILVRSDQALSLETVFFKNFATRYLVSKHVMCGSLFSLSYYGKSVVLEISEITGQTGSVPSRAVTTSALDSNQVGSQQMNGSAARDSANTSAISHLSRTDISNCSFTDASSTNFGDKSDFGDGSDSGERSMSIHEREASGDGEDESIIVGTVKTRSSLMDDSSSDLESQFSSLKLTESSRSFVSFSSTPKRTTQQSRKHGVERALSKSLSASNDMGVYRFTRTTQYKIVTNAEGGEKKQGSSDAEEQLAAKLGGLVTFDMIGGMERQVKAVKDLVQMPLTQPQVFSNLGIPPPRGVLLYGPPGVGKTMLARAVACQVNVHTVIINGPEVLSRYYGESESRLRALFEEAVQHAPSLILIDELDSLCPRRERVGSELEKRVVSTVVMQMDAMGQGSLSGKHVLVLGATSRPDAIDAALRRPGRFDREIEIGVPNATERRQIIEKLIASLSHNLTAEDVTYIADSAHGYVGADLTAVCKEAAMCAFERLRPMREGSDEQTYPAPVGSVSKADFLHAMTQVKPSALREVEIDIPKVYWTDIGGQEAIKLKLRQAVEWPIKYPEAFARLGVSPPRGVLLYGPPGCSKTLIAKALATESGLNFISVKGPELFSKWVGDSERAVREVFRKARSAAPAIVFFDEIDGIAVERGSSSGGSNVGDRVLGQLLTELDGVEGLRDVVVVAATNRPDMIDKALMRPGRLDRILYVSLPDDHTRREILNIQFRKMPVAEDCCEEELVTKTKGYSGAEVVALCREAALAAMQESLDIDAVGQRHFDQALSSVQPQTTAESIKFYEEYQKKTGLHSTLSI